MKKNSLIIMGLAVLLTSTGLSVSCAESTVTKAGSNDSDSDSDTDSDSDADTDTDTDADTDADTDECADVVCDSPPPNTCEDDTLTDYEEEGECVDGVCEYDYETEECLAGCVAGQCLPECTSGDCCDTDASEFLPTDHQCGTDILASEFECSDTDCGADARSRHQYQHCSGASEDCEDGTPAWTDWEEEDCAAEQACQTDDLTFAQCATCSAGCEDGDCIVNDETIYFPTGTDPWSTYNSSFYFWNAGDYIEGNRTTGLASIVEATIHVVIDHNTLSGDTQDANFIINGVTVGSFSIAGGATTVDQSFTFSSIAGPTYTLRYQTSSTVASGCGSANYELTSSTVTLSGG